MFDKFSKSYFSYNAFKAWEAFRNLPGARGFVFPKYEPVASHGDPIQARNSKNPTPTFQYILPNVKRQLKF